MNTSANCPAPPVCFWRRYWEALAVIVSWYGTFGITVNNLFNLPSALRMATSVLVTHPLQDGLVCAWFLSPGEGHVLFAQAGKCGADLG
jgi:hypothetical protein